MKKLMKNLAGIGLTGMLMFNSIAPALAESYNKSRRPSLSMSERYRILKIV